MTEAVSAAWEALARGGWSEALALLAMFAPNHQQTAAELLRVCEPGGTIALASWTEDGFIGEPTPRRSP